MSSNSTASRKCTLFISILGIRICLDLNLGLSAHISGANPQRPALLPKSIATPPLLFSSEAASVFCGGTLLSPEWFLTTAECATAHPGVLSVISPSSSIIPAAMPVTESIIHPQYTRGSIQYNLALLRLAQPLPSSHISFPKIIPVPANPSPESLLTIGWGTPSEGPAPTSSLSPVPMKDFTITPCAGPQAEDGTTCLDASILRTEACDGLEGSAITTNLSDGVPAVIALFHSPLPQGTSFADACSTIPRTGYVIPLLPSALWISKITGLAAPVPAAEAEAGVEVDPKANGFPPAHFGRSYDFTPVAAPDMN